MFEIEKGVSQEGIVRSGKGVKKYPFDQMEPGDSFVVKDPALHPSVRVQASKHSTGGRVFRCRAEGRAIRVFRLD